MSYALFKVAVFGTSKAGLATVGYALYNAAGTLSGARITAAVLDLGGGAYGALVTIPDSFQGRITWDTGEVTPAVASEPINPQEAENSDSKTSAVWSAASRTLTMSAAQLPAVLTGDTITLERGDTFTLAFTGLGSLAGRSKLWFTVKKQYDVPDTAAIVQIEETGGLLRLLGAAATASQGSLLVTDATTGALTVTLAAVAAALLEPGSPYLYDLQLLTGTTVHTLTGGSLTVVADITQVTG